MAERGSTQSEADTGDPSTVTSIENPVVGDRVLFLRRGEDTDGELLEVEIIAEPNAVGPPEHVHDHQEEAFEVLEGSLHATLDGEPFVVTAGESLVVPPGTPHRWWNGGDEELRFRGEIRPALEMAEFLETLYGLAADGKTNSKGVPNPIQMAVIADHYWETNHLASPPAPIQRLVFGILAPVGRLLGYRPYYPEYGAESTANGQ